MNFRKLALVFVSVTLLSSLISPALATNELSLIQLLAVNPCFKGKEELSPLCGYLMSKRMLPNVRFHGMYGSPHPSHFTHPAIIHPHGGHTPTVGWDSPLDYTSSLLQQFLPSPAGGTLLPPGSYHDFFRVMPVELVAALTKLYSHEKNRYYAPTEKEVMCFLVLQKAFPLTLNVVKQCMLLHYWSNLTEKAAASYPLFKSFFDDCFENWDHRHSPGSKQKAGAEEKWSLTHKECLQIDAQWKNKLTKPADTYATLLTNAMMESALYPKNLVESSLLTLLWKRLNLADIAPRAHEAFNDCVMALCNDQNWKDSSIPLAFSKSYYSTWKTNNMNEQGQLKAETVKSLIKDPNDLVYLTLLFNRYDQPTTSLDSGAAEFFTACFNRLVHGSGIRKINKLRNEWEKDAPSFVDYHRFFSQASKVSTQYPKERLDPVLLTLAQRKMCQEGVSKKTASNFIINLCPDEIQKNALDPSHFTKEFYMSWKAEALDPRGFLKSEALDKLLKHPEDLVFMTLMYDVYDNPFPLILGTASANYTFINEEGLPQTINFPDCGDASLLSALNVKIGNFKTRTFQIDLLKKFFPNIHPKLEYFYKEIQPIFEKINDSITGRSHWANVVSGLNEPGDMDPITYCHPKAQCEIQGSGDKNGLDNMLRVLGKLLGEPFTQMFPEESNPNKRRATIFTYLLRKLSFLEEDDSGSAGSASDTEDSVSESSASDTEDSEDEVGLTWYVKEKDNDKEIKDALPNFADVIIRRDGDDLFKWHFGDGHFQFSRAHSRQESDWRYMSKEMIQKVLKSDLPEVFKAHLMPFYVNLAPLVGMYPYQFPRGDIWPKNYEEYEENKKFLLPHLYEQGYLNEAMFGADLGGAEQKMFLMDQVISIDSKENMPLFINWIQKMPDDRAVNLELTCFLDKNQYYFTPEVMELLGSSVQERVKKTMFMLENNPTSQIFETLIDNKYSRSLLEYLYETLSDSVLNTFVHSRDSYGCTPLFHTMHMYENGIYIGIKWAKKFLDHGADLNAKDKDGETILSSAMTGSGSCEFLLLLLQHDQIDFMDAKKIIQEKENHPGWLTNFFYRSNSVDVLNILLKTYKIDPNRQVKDTLPPFLSAVFQENLPLINVFLEDERTDRNIMDTNPQSSPDTPLSWAVRNRKAEIVERLLQDVHVDPNMPDRYGATPLHLAYPHADQNLELFERLLQDTRVNPNVLNAEGQTLLEYACMSANRKIWEKLLDDPRIDHTVKCSNGRTLLTNCLGMRRDEEFTLKLCNHNKFDAVLTDDSGSNPFSLACEHGQWKVMDKLLDFDKINPNVRTNHGDTPLIGALRNGLLDLVDKFWNHHKTDRYMKNNDGESPFTLACQYEHWGVAEKFLEDPQLDPNGNKENMALPRILVCGPSELGLKLCNHPQFNPIMQDNKDNFPLSLACLYEHWSVAERILDYPQVNPNVIDQYGATPVSRAFLYNQTKLIERLIDFSHFNPNVKIDSIETLLTKTIKEARLDLAYKLCNHPQINRNMKNSYAESPLIVACTYQHWGVVDKLLEDPELDLKVRDMFGKTPRSIASSYGRRDIADRLPEF